MSRGLRRFAGAVVLLAGFAGCAPRHAAQPPVEFAGSPSATGCDAWLGIGGRFSQINDVRFVLENRSSNPRCQASTATVLFTGPLPADVLRVTTPSGWSAADAPCRSGGGTCGVVWRSKPGVPAGGRLEGFGLAYEPARAPRLEEWIVELGLRHVRMPIGTVGSRLSSVPEHPASKRSEHQPIRTPAAGTVVTRVVDAAGAPIPGVNVVAIPAAGGAGHRAATAQDGTWRLDLPEGTYRVDIEARGYDVERRNHVRVGKNASVTVEATLWSSAICECVYYQGTERLAARNGQVLDQAERPLPHARVEIVGSERREARSADAEGRFRVRAPVKGGWTLTASDSGFDPVTQQVSGSGSGPIVLKLPFTGTRHLPDEQRLPRGCQCPDDLFVHPGR